MACLNPQKLTVFPDKGHRLTAGKDSRVAFGQWIDSVDEDGELTQLFEVPCGKCVECLKDRRQRWTNRLLLEAASYDVHQVYFVTLTYDDEHLDYSESGVATLRKKHIQDWIRSLREYVEKSPDPDVYYGPPCKIRYFAAGEYGDRTLRPHYHVLLFGCDLFGYSPHVQVDKNNAGQILYSSDLISVTWRNGNNSVARFSAATAAYTCGYVNKKLQDEKRSGYDFLHIEPEFCLMSRRPGIGAKWLQDHKDEILKTGTYVLPFSDGVVLRPDRYALRCIFTDPVDNARIKIRKREQMNNRLRNQTFVRSMNVEDALRAVAEAKAQKFVKSNKTF